ncbi:hypothetical protein P879_11899 [Paragonimus westermani]|uniref:Uncharacterized protein n=1 Tax=Paragonimus westermani TaxID=34504 RepID=A0A8T0D6J8_9TREM|nr:hypothetical protein P879_11899 [Paragonimus westermani]
MLRPLVTGAIDSCTFGTTRRKWVSQLGFSHIFVHLSDCSCNSVLLSSVSEQCPERGVSTTGTPSPNFLSERERLKWRERSLRNI